MRAADAAGEHEGDADERDRERGGPAAGGTLAPQQHGAGDDERRVAAHQQRGQRDVDPFERREEEAGLEPVDRQPEQERRQQRPHGRGGDRAAREHAEHHGGQREADRADRRHARAAVEGEPDEDGLEREGAGRDEAEQRADALG